MMASSRLNDIHGSCRAENRRQSDISKEDLKKLFFHVLRKNTDLKRKVQRKSVFVSRLWNLACTLLKEMADVSSNIQKLSDMFDAAFEIFNETKIFFSKYDFEETSIFSGIERKSSNLKWGQVRHITGEHIKNLEKMCHLDVNGTAAESTPANLPHKTTRKKILSSSAFYKKIASMRSNKSTFDKQKEEESNNQNLRKLLKKYNRKILHRKRKEDISEEESSEEESQNEASMSVPTLVKSVRRQGMDSYDESTTDEFENDKHEFKKQTSIKRHIQLKDSSKDAVSINSGTSSRGSVLTVYDASQDVIEKVSVNSGTPRTGRSRLKEMTVDYSSQDVIKNEVSMKSCAYRRERRGRLKELSVDCSTQDGIKNEVFKNCGTSQRGRKVLAVDDASQDNASFYQLNVSEREDGQIEKRSSVQNLRNSFKRLKREHNKREEKYNKEELSAEESQSEEQRFDPSLVDYKKRQRRVSQEESTAYEEIINGNPASVKMSKHAQFRPKKAVNRNAKTCRRGRRSADASQEETFNNKLSIVCYNILNDPAFEYYSAVSHFKKNNLVNHDSPQDDADSAKGETFKILDEEQESFKDPESEDEIPDTEDINNSSKQATSTPCESDSAEPEGAVSRQVGTYKEIRGIPQ